MIKVEFDAIGQHEVIGDFEEIPEVRKALPSNWVFNMQRDGAGNVWWFQAWLVWGGNHQIEGIDYRATYASTPWVYHARLPPAIASKYHLKIHHMHGCTAFFGVDLEEEVYMHLPQGYIRLLQNGS